MALDTIIPRHAPGIAGFASESIGNAAEPRFGEGVPTTTTVNVPASFTGVIYQVVGVDANNSLVPAVYAADYSAGGVQPAGILTTSVVTEAGQTTTVDIYREGHWDMDALVWPASFDTDAKRKVAFEGGKSPNIFVSKKKFTSDAIDV